MDDDEAPQIVKFRYSKTFVQLFLDRKETLGSIKKKLENTLGKKSQSLEIFYTPLLQVENEEGFWNAASKYEALLIGERQKDGKYKILSAPMK
jgi:hypothetical protein